MTRRLVPCFVVVGLLTACSAGGTPPGVRRDGGGIARDGAILDGGDGRRDVGPPLPRPDAGPGFPDAACTATSPIATTIIGDPPDMLLTVDVSGSMCDPFITIPPSPSFDTKMSIMKTSLRTLVGNWETRINFGMMLFPAASACGPGAVRNEIAPLNASPINTTLNGIQDSIFSCGTQNGSNLTPTHLSVDAARAYYGTIPENPIGRFVLLATDGLPNCGPDATDGSDPSIDETVTAIAALRDAGIRTYVLGLGDAFGGGSTELNRMAVAGGTGTPFAANSAAALDMALEMIAAEIVPPSCTVELDGPTRSPELFQVSFDGGPLIPRNPAHTSGWDYDATANTITFYGAECDTVQSGSVASIDVDFGCPGPLI